MTWAKPKPRYVHRWRFSSGECGVIVHDGRHELQMKLAVQSWLDAGWCTADEAWFVARDMDRFFEAMRLGTQLAKSVAKLFEAYLGG